MNLVNIMRKVVLFSFLLCMLKIYGQENPPPPAQPNFENKILIDELIKVTEYENFFNQYCLMKIRRISNEEKWTEKQKKDIIESIKFKYFCGTIYNAFSFTPDKELKEMIEFYSKINKTAKFHKYIIANEMMMNNLEGFADSLVKGKYITTNNSINYE